MKLQRVGTKRNGFPCTALLMDMDMVRQVQNALTLGALIRVEYVNLQGITETRQCYIEAVNTAAHVFTIKHSDFGYRTVCFERVLNVNREVFKAAEVKPRLTDYLKGIMRKYVN